MAPVHPDAGVDGRGPLHHRRGRGQLPHRRGRQALPRRRVVAVVQPVRPPPPGAGPGPQGADRPHRPLDLPGAVPRAGNRAGRPAHGAGAGRTHPRVLLGQRRHRGGGGAQAGGPVLATAGRDPEDPVRAAGGVVSRRHGGSHERGLQRPVPPLPPGPAVPRPGGEASLRLPAGARAERGRGHGALGRRGPRDGRPGKGPPGGLHHGAGHAGGRGHVAPAGRLRQGHPGHLQGQRRPVHRRRGGHGVRPHRTDVGLRARRRQPGPHVRRQGDHRRLPAASRNLRHRGGLFGVPGGLRRVQELLPRPHLHRQPPGLRGGGGRARRLRAGGADGEGS